jgi:L-gulonolactone oxidase
MPGLSSLPTQSLYDTLAAVTVPRAAFANWAKTYVCDPHLTFEPRTVDECALIFELARRQGKTVRAAGIGHSPSDLVCTDKYMLRTTKLNAIRQVSSLPDQVLE